MTNMRQRKFLFAVVALLLIFAACKGESPTSPSSGVTPSTPSTPPSGATITLAVSNASPLTNSTSIITATVTQNGTAVPDGTAVQFTTTLGSFTDTGSSGATVIKTTKGGVATATLTSGASGPAVVTVAVNNAVKTTTITFSATPTTPPTPSTSPTITSITPATGRPEGGETITIIGTNFRNPVRVIFTCEGSAATPPDPAACNGQGPKDAFVSSVTPTQITAITPAFNIATGQAVTFSIKVLSGAGTSTEGVVSQSGAFTFTSPTLTPKITTVSPSSGPLEGGTRVTIFGTGFQSPVQVTMGTSGASGAPLVNQVEVQVISVTFSQIVFMTPEYRLIDPGLTLLPNGQVALRVLNINSATDAVLSSGFRYMPRMQITNISPSAASAIGGSQIRIDGIGFDDPVAVSVAGVVAQPIRVSGTEVIARLGNTASPCSGGSGPVIITNINTGDTATSAQVFTYIPVNPVITGTNPAATSTTITPGSSIAVDVQDPGVGPLGSAVVSFNVGSTTISPSPSQITNGVGTTTFNVVIPANFQLTSAACITAGGLTGTQFVPTNAPLSFQNVTTSCSTSLPGGITITPTAAQATCVVPPTAAVTSPAQTCPVPNLTPAAQASAGAATHSATITITNNAAASANLALGVPVIGTPTNATAVIAPNTAQSVPPGGSVSYTITLDPTAAGPDSATVTFSTNDPNQKTVTVTVCGTGT
jgi:hypothetical protein